MTELNRFYIATGNIDTTSETAPISIAMISLHHKLYQLALFRKTRSGNEVIEEYKFENIRLRLQYHRTIVAGNAIKYEGSYLFQDGSRSGSAQKIIGVKGYL
ncbi:MAG: hypothetical protein V4450_12055 [Bacteroidota bacterium]